MRILEIIEICDRCGTRFDEGVCRTLTLSAISGTMDEAMICDVCVTNLNITWVPKKQAKRKRKPKRDDDPVHEKHTYHCGALNCDRVFNTERGLHQHQTKSGH